ncbi:MAG TPA: Hsp70 family protein, partial [Phytomonospora sp.]
VFAPPGGALLVGRDALESARRDPSRFEPNPKRRIDDGTVLLGERELPVGDLFAAVLGRVRREYTEVTGGPPSSVSLTFPAAWGPARRLVLADAARQAGFGDPRLVPEPVAAATYFVERLEREVPVGSAVVVHDFGGGTFDASVVRRTPGGFEVLAVDGLDDLGGVDIDEAIVAHLRARVGDPERWARLLNPATPAGLRHRRTFAEDVRLAKERLSRQTTADLFLPVFETDVHLTRDELDEITAPMLARAVRVVQAVIRVSGVPREALAGVFLVGGSSRMPLVATMLHRELGTPPTVIDQIEQVVAHGALLDTATAGSRPVSAPPAPVPVPAAPVSPPTWPAPLARVSPPTPTMVMPESATVPVPAPPQPVHAPPAPAWQSAPPPEPEWRNAPPPLPAKRRSFVLARTLPAAMTVVTLLVVAGWVYFVNNGFPGAGDLLGDSPDPTAVYSGHEWTVEHLEVTELDGRPVVVSGSMDKWVQVWDAETGAELTSFGEHKEQIEGVAVGEGKDGPVVVSYGMMDPDLFVWDPADGDLLRKIATSDVLGSPSHIAAGLIDGAPVVVGVTGGTADDGGPEATVAVWNLDSGKLLHDWTAPVNVLDMATGSVDGKPVVVLGGLGADERTRVDVRTMAGGKKVATIAPEAGGGRYEDAYDAHVGIGAGERPPVVTVNGNATPEIWDAADGTRLGAYDGHTDTVSELDVVQWGDRTVVVSAASDDVIRVWDTAGETIATYDPDDFFGLEHLS